MADPRPVRLTTVATNPSAFDPEPLVVVAPATAGTAGLVTRQPAISNQANAGTLADLAAAQAAINTLTAKVNAILAALRNAGILVP